MLRIRKKDEVMTIRPDIMYLESLSMTEKEVWLTRLGCLLWTLCVAVVAYIAFNL